jgi:hypothetical protein
MIENEERDVAPDQQTLRIPNRTEVIAPINKGRDTSFDKLRQAGCPMSRVLCETWDSPIARSLGFLPGAPCLTYLEAIRQ